LGWCLRATCVRAISIWGSQKVISMARRWHWGTFLGIVRLIPQESTPVDDGCDPDGIVCEPIQHTVTANDDFPIAKRREFWHNATALGERCEALGGCQQPLNQRFGCAWRVPRDEVVDVP
jgi:hypothetical protein